MCGIFGYVGSGNAVSVVLDGLKRLDYRGYDSWGVASVDSKGISVSKRIGILDKSFYKGSLSDSKISIGHTRWATHGAVTKTNAHPHLSSDGSFALAHNGIIENFEKLHTELTKQGYKFKTETDTEAVVGLIEKYKKQGNLLASFRKAVSRLKGRNTVILLTLGGKILASRNGSPLVIGKKDEEIFFSSDALSFAPYTKKAIVVENGETAVFDGSLKLINTKSGKEVTRNAVSMDIADTKAEKGKFGHFMIKEIFDTPEVLMKLASAEKKKLAQLAIILKKARRIYVIGSGSSGVSAAQIAYYLRKEGGLNATSLVGAEANSYYGLFKKGDLLIAPSQSGETADVLEVLEIAKNKKVKIVTYTNMPGSMMERMSDINFRTPAGPEFCVMSTKVLSAMNAWGYLVAMTASDRYKKGKENIVGVAKKLNRYLASKKNHQKIKMIGRKLLDKESIFLLAKGQNLEIAKEGMVKIIEGTYKHAHGIPAGDLKHYAITIMDKGVPVIVLLSKDSVFDDVVNAINEVKARKAYVIGISSEKMKQFADCVVVPELGGASALFNMVPLQLISYYMAVMMGNNVDKPRNIAKSVTVK